MKEQIKALKEMLFKPGRTNKPKDEQAELALPKKRGAKPGHPGTTRPKPGEIDEQVEVRPKKCPHCGSTRIQQCRGFSDHIQEDIVLPRPKATRFRHYLGYCLDCKKVIKAGPGKDEIPGSYLGPQAKSLANFMHYAMGVPYGKIAEFFQKIFKLKIDPSSVYGFDNQAREKSTGLYEEIKTKLKDSKYVHADETGWPNDGKPFWLWCLATLDLVFYQISKKRKATVVSDILGKAPVTGAGRIH